MSERHNPLIVCVTAEGELQIRIGIDTLAWAFEQREQNSVFDEFSAKFRVTDSGKLADSVAHRLMRETTETGHTAVTELLEQAMEWAIEDGCEGVEEVSGESKSLR
jgi:hypothetical protein